MSAQLEMFCKSNLFYITHEAFLRAQLRSGKYIIAYKTRDELKIFPTAFQVSRFCDRKRLLTADKATAVRLQDSRSISKQLATLLPPASADSLTEHD